MPLPRLPVRRRPWRRAAVLALLAALPAGGCGGLGTGGTERSSGAAAAMTVPLTYLPAGSVGGKLGEPRLQAAVRVGSQQLNVLVDTGSTGLRVLASAVGRGNATPTGAGGSISFLSGLRVSGREAQAKVGLAGAGTWEETLLLVDSLGCTAEVPDCEAAHGKAPEEFGGVFDGILGIGLAERDQGVRGCCANPLQAPTHNGSFVVHFDQRRPRLLLNPDRKSLDRFSMVSLRQSVTRAPAPGASPTAFTVWDPTPITGCLSVTSVLDTQCAPMVFDTGTPTLSLQAPRLPGPAAGQLVEGDIVNTFGRRLTLSVPGAHWSWTYRMPPRDALDQPLNALDTPLLSYGRQPHPLILAGLPAFAKVDVLYDLGGGRMGLAPR
ncbi:DUF3443 family protein [Streptomyces orinoci]|uniref:DUF3443 family protein n=1 Tax=Streptomyces orinoci TaxID=67339 RepID=A0ABV3K784_STRON|nr:DUF3443 family protein [Streptomyces orinoci]